MARFGSWVMVEPKFVKNTKVESLISRSLGGTLKLTTRGRVGFYFSVQTSFDHNLAIPKHAIPNQNILSPFLSLFDPFFGQKWRKIIFSAIVMSIGCYFLNKLIFSNINELNLFLQIVSLLLLIICCKIIYLVMIFVLKVIKFLERKKSLFLAQSFTSSYKYRVA